MNFFHEFLNIQSIELEVSHIIPANLRNISSLFLVSYFLVNFNRDQTFRNVLWGF